MDSVSSGWKEWGKVLAVLQALILGLLVAAHVLLIDMRSRAPQNTDFYKFYMSAKFFWEGRDIYSIIPIDPALFHYPTGENALTGEAKDIKTLHPNLNSPFHTLFVILFGLMDFPKAYWLWSILSLGSALVGAALISGQVFEKGRELLPLLSLEIVMLCYFPSYATNILGQFGFVLLLLITLAWLAAKKGADREAGLILGLGMGLKIFLGIFLIVFVLYRRWRLLAWFSGTFLICNLLSLLVFGVPTYKEFLSLLKDMPWYAGSWNASWTGFLTRIFGGSNNNSLFALPWLGRALAAGFSAVLLCLLIRLAWPDHLKPEGQRFDLVFSLAIVEMLLISPYGWLYYFPVLLIPLAVAWQACQRLEHGFRFKLLVALSWILSSYPTTLLWAEHIRKDQPVSWFFTTAGFHFYSLILFTGTLTMLLGKMGRGGQN